MECSPPGSSVHGILQARILEWVAISSSRGSSQPRDQTHVSCVSFIGRQILYQLSQQGSPHEQRQITPTSIYTDNFCLQHTHPRPVVALHAMPSQPPCRQNSVIPTWHIRRQTQGIVTTQSHTAQKSWHLALTLVFQASGPGSVATRIHSHLSQSCWATVVQSLSHI